MEEKEIFQPNYWSVIPAEVRYDKDLSPRAIILYSEISALTQKTGVCWATNKYFAELYGVSDRAVKDWIKQLVEKGYIISKIQRNPETKEVIKRNLFITNARLNVGGENNIPTPSEDFFPTPSEENFPKNNTSISNNTSKDIKENISISKDIDIKRKSEICKQVIDYLNAKTQSRYKWQSHTKNIIARINEGYTLDDFKHVIDVKTADWLNDEKMNRFLQPSTLFAKCHFDNYLNQKTKKQMTDQKASAADKALEEFLKAKV